MREWLVRAGVTIVMAAVGGGVAGYTQGGWWPGLGGVVGGALGFWASVRWGRREQARAATAARAQHLDLYPLAMPAWTRAASLLLAEHQVAPFRGRGHDLEELRSWWADPRGAPVCLVLGAAGVGKTRLVDKFAADLAAGDGVAAGRLRVGHEADALAAIEAVGTATLVVVELRGRRPELADFIRDVAAHRDTTCASGLVPQVRVLLVARSVLGVRVLQQQVRQLDEPAADMLTFQLREEAGRGAHVVAVAPQGTAEDVTRWAREAAVAFANRLARSVPASAVRIGPPVTWSEVQLRALLSVLAGAAVTLEDQAASIDALAEGIFDHDRSQWPACPVSDVDEVVQLRAVVALALLGARDEEHAAHILARVPDLRGADDARRRLLARWVREIYPGTSGVASEWVGLPQPDVLVRGVLNAGLDAFPGWDRALFPDSDPGTWARAISLLVGVIPPAEVAALWSHAPAGVVLDDLLPSLASARHQGRVDLVLTALVEQLSGPPLELVADLVAGGGYPQALVATARRKVALVRQGQDRLSLAKALASLGVRLGWVGGYPEALAAAEEAVALWRELAAEAPAVHRPEFAHAVIGLGVALERVGRYPEALAADEEAVALWRELAASAPAVYRPNLAQAVHGLGVALERVGRYPEALTAVEEAMALWRDLAAEAPAVHRPDLARAVIGLGVALERVGRYPEALAVYEEAVALWRELAASAPAVHRPDLARAIAYLGVELERVGRYPEALTAAEEAVALWRQLAAAAPAVHRPDLAQALAGLGAALERVGRYAEALATVEEAVALWRELAAAAPAVYWPDLARAVSNLGAGLGQVGRHRDALVADEEAVALWRELAATAPAVYRPNFARAVHALGLGLERVGRYPEALAAAEEAVALWRELAAEAPAVHRPDLARAVHALGLGLERVGRYPEALAAVEEAIALYSDPAQPPPLTRDGLAQANRSRRALLERLGRTDEQIFDLRHIKRQRLNLWTSD